MTLEIFKYLGLVDPTPNNIRLLMDDRSIKWPIRIFFDVLVKVDSFIFLANFVILDCKVNFEVTVILGILFLATKRVLIYLKFNELKFLLNDEEVSFDK